MRILAWTGLASILFSAVSFSVNADNCPRIEGSYKSCKLLEPGVGIHPAGNLQISRYQTDGVTSFDLSSDDGTKVSITADNQPRSVPKEDAEGRTYAETNVASCQGNSLVLETRASRADFLQGRETLTISADGELTLKTTLLDGSQAPKLTLTERCYK